jgi:hypothetical protein
MFEGPPIHGALLTGNFIWWRPALESGVCAPILKENKYAEDAMTTLIDFCRFRHNCIFFDSIRSKKV